MEGVLGEGYRIHEVSTISFRGSFGNLLLVESSDLALTIGSGKEFHIVITSEKLRDRLRLVDTGLKETTIVTAGSLLMRCRAENSFALREVRPLRNLKTIERSAIPQRNSSVFKSGARRRSS